MPSKKTFTAGRSVKKKSTKAFVNRRETEWWQKETRKLSAAQLCERCSAVWFDGHWHTAPAMAAALKAKKSARGGSASGGKLTKKSGKQVLCYESHIAVNGPADPTKMAFEGELTLDGLTDPSEKAKVLLTCRNFGARANKRDPEDRIISIDDRGGRVVITTTENQMAVGMGKAVDSAFKGGRLRIVWSKDDMPARVFWVHK